MTFQKRLEIINTADKIQKCINLYSLPTSKACIHFIKNWCFTFDPRLTGKKTIPFELYPKQEEFIIWLWDKFKNQESGLVDKCRDVGATWLVVSFFVWLLCFHRDISMGLYSYKESEVHKQGDISTLMEKSIFILNHLPRQFKQGITKKFMYIKNTRRNNDIAGSSGDNPGRGGRRSIFFCDEAAFYPRAEMIEASLSETTNCKIDVSTHSGTNSLFFQKISSGALPTFIFNWVDNPQHTRDWYNKKKDLAEKQGLLHIFKREIDRDPRASIENVVIPSNWVNSMLENTNKITTGKRIAGLDVADEGGDTNSITIFCGNELIYIDEWGQGDTIETANRAFAISCEYRCDELRYDAIGVGAGVKARIRTIKEELQEELVCNDKDEKANIQKSLNMRILGWNAGGKVIRPDDDDFGDKPNKELFENAKSQAYWKLRNEFNQTHRFVNDKEYSDGELLSVSDKVKKNLLLNKLVNELSQPQHKLSASGKIIIDKKPNRSKSPNIAESFLIARTEVEPEWLDWKII